MRDSATSEKKKRQLGKHPATAAHKLRTDILFSFIQMLNILCFRCGGEMTRKTFSIDHKDNWMDSDDPVGRFFDLKNIGFSHQACNYGAARRTTMHSDEDLARMDPRTRSRVLSSRKNNEKRRAKDSEDASEA